MRGQTRKNRCRCVIALTALVSPLFVSFAGAETSLPSPRAQVADSVFDFGTVAQGTTVSHDFIMKNIGTGPLNIHRVVPACGCTAASSSGDVIAPGAEGKIAVRLDTSDFTGEKLKLVRVFTSDQEDPSITLTMKGTIEPNVVIEPNRINFDRVTRGAPQNSLVREISITLKPETGLEIADIKSFSKLLSVRTLEQTAQHARVAVTLASDAPVGEFRDRLIVNLRGKQESSVNVPVFALVEGPLKLTPGTISVGVLEGAEVIERSVKFDNTGPGAVRISSVKSSDPAVTADYAVIKDGANYVLRVRVDPSKVSRDLRAVVTVETDSKTEAPVALNVFGILPPKG